MSEQMAVKPEVAALLRRVKRRILAQPKRFDMNTWGDKRAPKEGGPACGTAACIAGWIALDRMTIPEVKGLPRREFSALMKRAWRIAEKAVGAPAHRFADGSFAAHRLFVAQDWPVDFWMRYRMTDDVAERATVAAERIEHFIRTGE